MVSDMPLVDNIDQCTAQPKRNGSAENHLVHFASKNSVTVPNSETAQLKAALANAERRYLMVRSQCLVRGRMAAQHEPRSGYLWFIGTLCSGIVVLGVMVMEGFKAVHPLLMILPGGTMAIALLFLLRSFCEHGFKMIRLNRAKRRWLKQRTEILAVMNHLPATNFR